jgi:hypothetical protein
MRNIPIMLRLHRCFRLLMFESSGTPIAKVFPAKGSSPVLERRKTKC